MVEANYSRRSSESGGHQDLPVLDLEEAGPSQGVGQAASSSFRPDASSSPRREDLPEELDLSDSSLSDIEREPEEQVVVDASQRGDEPPLEEGEPVEVSREEAEEDDLSFTSTELNNAEPTPTLSQLESGLPTEDPEEDRGVEDGAGGEKSPLQVEGANADKTQMDALPKDPVLPPNLPATASEALNLLPPDLRKLCTVGEEVVFSPEEDLDWRTPSFPWALVKEGAVQFVIGRHPVGFPSSHVLQKEVYGKTLVSLTEEGRKIPQLLEAFSRLKAPEKLPIWEAQLSRQRREQFFWFLRTPNSNCGEAMGDWSVGQEEDTDEQKDSDLFELTQAEAKQIKSREPPKNAVSVGKLPLPLKELVKGERPARPVTPPLAFNLVGKRGSEAKGYHDAVYGGSKQSSDWLN